MKYKIVKLTGSHCNVLLYHENMLLFHW